MVEGLRSPLIECATVLTDHSARRSAIHLDANKFLGRWSLDAEAAYGGKQDIMVIAFAGPAWAKSAQVEPVTGPPARLSEDRGSSDQRSVLDICAQKLDGSFTLATFIKGQGSGKVQKMYGALWLVLHGCG
eukprot:6324729-Amphidinium_carterae.1